MGIWFWKPKYRNGSSHLNQRVQMRKRTSCMKKEVFGWGLCLRLFFDAGLKLSEMTAFNVIHQTGVSPKKPPHPTKFFCKVNIWRTLWILGSTWLCAYRIWSSLPNYALWQNFSIERPLCSIDTFRLGQGYTREYWTFNFKKWKLVCQIRTSFQSCRYWSFVTDKFAGY